MRPILAIISICLLAACAEWGTLSQKDLLPDTTMERVKSAASQSPVTAQQRETFGVLADFAGRTFRGTAQGADADSVVADIQLWVWGEDGRELLIKHALEDGSYGGNTVIFKDPASGKLSYTYQTNAGFSTLGEFTLEDDGSWEAVEEVSGDSDITKVRSRGHVREDGALVSASEYLTAGEWEAGHSFIYREVWQDLPALKTPVPE